MTRKNDLMLLAQLYDGNHLTDSELNAVSRVVSSLQVSISQRATK
jgi:hypothetical protein